MNEKKKNTLGITGCIISFVALVAAFLSPQIAEAIDPPAKPIGESAVDFALKLKDVAVAKAKGEEYQSEPTEKNPSSYLFTAVIGFGMVGTGFGLGSLIRGEKKSISSGAMTLGITAAIVLGALRFALAHDPLRLRHSQSACGKPGLFEEGPTIIHRARLLLRNTTNIKPDDSPINFCLSRKKREGERPREPHAYGCPLIFRKSENPLHD